MKGDPLAVPLGMMLSQATERIIVQNIVLILVLTIKPNFYTEYMGANDQPRQAQVIYIHPEGRFYVVEFRSDLGIPWRETFYPYTRRIADIADKSAPHLPHEKELAS